jgi:hypothetical protein
VGGAISRPRRKQAGDSQEKRKVILEARKPRSVNRENRKAGNLAAFYGFLASRLFPLFLLS